jgi:hypothetical protein
MEKHKAKVSKKRQVNTYAEMWHASYVMLHKAKKDQEGSFYQLMASLIFTAFTLEAYLNHIGQRIFGCWDDLEQLSPLKKLNVIAEKLGVEKDDGKRPFQTASELFQFRNDVAHGKSVSLQSDDQIRVMADKFDEYMRKPLETRWEAYCTLENAERAREDIESIIRKLHDASGITDDMLFNSGMWFGSATLLP